MATDYQQGTNRTGDLLPPVYPIPWGVLLRLIVSFVLGKERSFRLDAINCVAKLKNQLRVFGEENIPGNGPCVVTFNHYSRPGFGVWWVALAISSLIPIEVHWTMTSGWTYPDFWRQQLFTPITQWVFRRLAAIYDFTLMPPMPPKPEEVEARAFAVRRVLTWARQSLNPILALAPEGRDSHDGKLCLPPPGVGRFLLLLSQLGCQFVPLGAFEEGGCLCLRFGKVYRLEDTAGWGVEARDLYVRHFVMSQIAEMLPPHLRGEFGAF